MDLTLGPEQEAIRDAVRTMLAERQPTARVRQTMTAEPPVDDALWSEAAALGWFGLALPEAAGGAGYGHPEAMLLFQELGRGVVPGPWLGTVLAARALAAAGDPRLGEVVAGRCRVAVIDDPEDRLGMRGRLDGEATSVLDAGSAGAFLVLGGER